MATGATLHTRRALLLDSEVSGRVVPGLMAVRVYCRAGSGSSKFAIPMGQLQAKWMLKLSL